MTRIMEENSHLLEKLEHILEVGLNSETVSYEDAIPYYPPEFHGFEVDRTEACFRVKC